MKLPFNNPKGTIIAIVLIITLACVYWANADAAEIEVGGTYTGEFNGGMGVVLTERFADKLDLGISLFSEQDWNTLHVENNGNVWFGFVSKKPERWWKVLPSEVTLGAGVWFKNTNVHPITNCYPTFTMGLKWRISKHWSVGVRHWSNAGICTKNRGQDFAAFGLRF